ncbi:MAG: TPM domain-containing protein [Lachnospiraceae bacterium]|nr:TPM domain-containing protein [Lachnospiraceae bacterium]
MRKLITLLPALILSMILLPAVPGKAAGIMSYTNPETQYTALILDDLDLISDAEETQLLQDMQPVTEFANAAFWTTDQWASNEIEQARLKRRDLFDLTNGTIFVINMNIRKITIQSYGIDDIITSGRANSITNNVRSYATSGDYYMTASKAFSQIHTVLSGNRIAEPMKVMSNICLALMGGLLLMFGISYRFSSSFIRPTAEEMLGAGSKPITIRSVNISRLADDVKYSPPSSNDSDSGGGSSCSSCGSGGSSSF